MSDTATPTFSQSVFDDSVKAAQSLIHTQMNPSAPAVTQLQTGTNLLIGDRSISSRLGHFPDDLYDLRDESHLVRFMSALLGDSGAGQLRKRYLLTRIQAVLDSATFFDLDGFYGAIFGNGRQPSEVLPIDPYQTSETPEAWDDIAAIDAHYRERIAALAAAIPMAATVPGIRQAAEAIVGSEVDVYEAWRSLDAGTSTPPSSGETWNAIQADYPLWSDINGTLWNDLDPSGFTLSNLATPSPDEVIIKVKKVYEVGAEGDRQKALDEYALLRVLGILRSANTVITVSQPGIPIHRTVPIGSVDADSEFWEVVTKVVPNVAITPAPGLYALSPSQVAAGIEWGDERTLPRPPRVNVQGQAWEQASAVVSVTAAEVSFDNDEDITQPGTGPGVIMDALNYQTVSFFDGTSQTYSAERGSADPKTVQGGIAISSGILTAAPYAAPRTTVVGV